MSEFSTSAELEVRVSDSSLRAAKQQIEDELGATNVNATASNQLRSDGGVSSGRGGITELLTEQQQTNAHFEDNLTLNETRNDLLRELVENTEGGSGGGDGLNLRNLLRGGLAGLIGLGGVALGLSQVNWGRLISDSLPDLDPGDIIDPVQVGVGDIIAAGATVSASALILSRLTVEAGHLIAERASIAVSDLISNPVEVGATALLGALIANPVTLTAQQILDHLVEGGSGSSDPSTDPTTDPSTDPSSDPSTDPSSDPSTDPSSDPSSDGFFDDVIDGVTDPRVLGASAAVGGGGALAALASSGTFSGILSGAGGTLGGGFGAATSGSMSAAALAPMATVLAAAGGTAYGGSQLAEIAGGGDGIDTVHNAGEDFSESNPDAADTIHDTFTNNPVHGAGQWVGDQVNNDDDGGGILPFAEGGIVTDRTEAVIGEGGEPEAVFPLSRLGNFLSGQQSRGGGSVTVDATIENVDVSAEGTSREEITQRTLEEIRRELMRQLPDDISNTQQRRFESRF